MARGRPKDAPAPTELYYDFITASERAEVSRVSKERQQVEQLRAALEAAERREREIARRTQERGCLGASRSNGVWSCPAIGARSRRQYLEVVAYNASNLLASLAARTTIKFEGSADTVKSTLHVLAIGINAYVDEGWRPPGSADILAFPPLELAVGDAKALDIAPHHHVALFAQRRVEQQLSDLRMGGQKVVGDRVGVGRQRRQVLKCRIVGPSRTGETNASSPS